MSQGMADEIDDQLERLERSLTAEDEEWERIWGFARPATEVERRAFLYGLRLGVALLQVLFAILLLACYYLICSFWGQFITLLREGNGTA